MEKTTKKPEYRGNLSVALWSHKDKNGKTYYTLKIGNIANLFEAKIEEATE